MSYSNPKLVLFIIISTLEYYCPQKGTKIWIILLTTGWNLFYGKSYTAIILCLMNKFLRKNFEICCSFWSQDFTACPQKDPIVIKGHYFLISLGIRGMSPKRPNSTQRVMTRKFLAFINCWHLGLSRKTWFQNISIILKLILFKILMMKGIRGKL